jgi:hypothetical protein
MYFMEKENRDRKGEHGGRKKDGYILIMNWLLF